MSDAKALEDVESRSLSDTLAALSMAGSAQVAPAQIVDQKSSEQSTVAKPRQGSQQSGFSGFALPSSGTPTEKKETLGLPKTAMDVIDAFLGSD